MTKGKLVGVALATALGFLSGITSLTAEPHANNRRGSATQGYSRGDAEKVARRLYLGLLGREPDPAGLAAALDGLQRGNTLALVTAVVQSAEFRDHTASKASVDILDQMYRGFLGRAPDPTGTRTFLADIERRLYADVTMRFLASEEFRMLPASVPTPGTAAPNLDFGRAVECLATIVAKADNDMFGHVMIRFDRPLVADASEVSGTAVDVTDRGRRLSYRCVGSSASYTFEDGRTDRSAPTSGELPDASVRACAVAIRADVQRERPNDDVEFESAGLMPKASGEAIRGLAFERGGRRENFYYSCEMEGVRVVSASFRWR